MSQKYIINLDYANTETPNNQSQVGPYLSLTNKSNSNLFKSSSNRLITASLLTSIEA